MFVDVNEESIVKGNTILGLLATTAIFALSATAAHAGNGGLPSALTSFFACYSINGKDSGQTVDLETAAESPIASANMKNVRIGSGTLACAIVRMLVPPNAAPQVLAEPNPTQDLAFNAMKCYAINNPGGTSFPGPKGTLNFTDAIFGTLGSLDVPGNLFPGSPGTESGVQVSQLKFICAPAVIGP